MDTKVPRLSFAYPTSIINNSGNKSIYSKNEFLHHRKLSVGQTTSVAGSHGKKLGTRGVKFDSFNLTGRPLNGTQPSSPSLITSSPLPPRPVPSFPLRSGEEYREYRCTPNNIPVYEFSRILKRVKRKGDGDAWNVDWFFENRIIYNIKFYSYIRIFNFIHIRIVEFDIYLWIN